MDETLCNLVSLARGELDALEAAERKVYKDLIVGKTAGLDKEAKKILLERMEYHQTKLDEIYKRIFAVLDKEE